MAKKASVAVKKRTKKKRKILSAEEKAQKKREKKLHSDVKLFFKTIGLEYISTRDKQKIFGGIQGEFDGIYIYKNIITLVEETTSSNNDHLRRKVDYFEKVLENKESFLQWLSEVAPEKFSFPGDYTVARYKLFYCYASETAVGDDTAEVYSQLKYLSPSILKYFIHVAKSIRLSARNEFFKYLGLDHPDIGEASSSTEEKYIDSAVIIPEAGTGFPTGIHIVSFVMKAQELLDCAYVFRKDSWGNKLGQYYQRLVEKAKIDKIRAFLAKEKRTFIDNIIVSLPSGTTFAKIEKNNKRVDIDVKDISTISNVQIRIPYLINSIGIIDGQHRVFGHYQGSDSLEPAIQKHREKRHLFVTGIFYEEDKYKEPDRRKFESSLFLLMNNNHSKVKPDLLLYIESLKSPTSPLGIASNVIMALNNRDPFKGLFLLSPLDKIGIKTPTIIKYGLQGLVEISADKETLFKYWQNDKKTDLLNETWSEELYADYIKFCASSLSQYFNAIKSNYKDSWDLANKDSRLLSSTAIVGFLKSFSTSLEKYHKIGTFEFYKPKIAKLTLTFSKTEFAKYGSSHWPTLAQDIDKECWK